MSTDEHPNSAAPTLPRRKERPNSVDDEAYDIRIARDGTWLYHGSPIGRSALVKLFATVLRRDDAGGYWLITPAERGRIVVDDAPFVAIELRAEGEGEAQILAFRTNLDDWVTAGPDNPIRAEGDALSGAPSVYILIRDGLDARIGRAVYYELVGLAVERRASEGTELGVWSNRIFYPLGRIPKEPTEI